MVPPPDAGRQTSRHAPRPRPRLVAAAAIVVDGTVLAARRTAPPPVAGLWELPGGKVEPGESPEQAAVREVDEELGVPVRALRRLGRRQPIRPGLSLVVVLAELTGRPPTSSVVHDELRWLRADQLGDVEWLPADQPVLALLRSVLAPDPDGAPGTPSATRTGPATSRRARQRRHRRRRRGCQAPVPTDDEAPG